jgi:AraC-like DNA-binding protein
MIDDINSVLQVSAVTLVALTCLLFLRFSQRGMHTWAGVGFTISIICYLIIDSEFVDSSTALFFVVVTGAVNIPIFFWILSRAVFDDHFKPTWKIGAWVLVQMVPHVHVYLRPLYTFPEGATTLFHTTGQVVSIGFLLAGLYTAFKTRKGDLIDARMRFRNIFITVTALLIGITLIVEASPLVKHSPEILQVLQRCGIVLLTLYFLLSNVELKAGFFFNEYPKQKSATVDDPLLLERLQRMLNDEHVYKKEGLTIGDLANLMNEREHRVRRLINGQLGFRNFSDFVNQYRIAEAAKILSDPAQSRRTVLEIAYDVGYQSIGPFNKAFKELHGVTPTVYRKNHLKQ